MSIIYKRFDHAPHTYFTAWDVDGLVGYLIVDVDEFIEICALDVHRTYRRQGLATALLGMARDAFPGRNVDPGPCSKLGKVWWRSVALASDAPATEMTDGIADDTTLRELQVLGRWLHSVTEQDHQAPHSPASAWHPL